MKYEKYELTEELEKIAGGTSEADETFAAIRSCIANGKANVAKTLYKNFCDQLTDTMKQRIKIEFQLKFGYLIA